MSDDQVGGWVKKGQNHDDVVLEWSPRDAGNIIDIGFGDLDAHQRD